MRLIDSNPCLAKRIALKGIAKFRKAYKLPKPQRIRNADFAHYPVYVGYVWDNVCGKSCELWVITDEKEARWNCLVASNIDCFTFYHTKYEICSEDWKMVQSVVECLELWFSINVRAP